MCLVAQIFTYKYYDVPIAVPAVPEEVDVAANAFRGVAIVTCSVDAARRVDVEALGVDG